MFLGKELINIMLEVTKVSTGEDPSAEVPRKSGGGRGRRERDGSRVEHGKGPCNCPPSLMSDTSWELALRKKREIQL